MKNGEPRSAKWIAKGLKGFKRDDPTTQALLSLVDLRPIPALDELRTWTDEQVLLAEDWASCVHSSASDNLNRVPAIPEHLKAYRPEWPQRTAAEAATAAVKEMSSDNCVTFLPSVDALARLEGAMLQMQASGCHFTDAEISLLAAGEDSECREHFQQYKGFVLAHNALIEIFEGPTDFDPEAPASSTQTPPPGDPQ